MPQSIQVGFIMPAQVKENLIVKEKEVKNKLKLKTRNNQCFIFESDL